MSDDRFGKDAPEGGFSQNCSLRDYFAGQAMIAVAATWKGNIGDIKREDLWRTAEISYAFADAMLKERSK